MHNKNIRKKKSENKVENEQPKFERNHFYKM